MKDHSTTASNSNNNYLDEFNDQVPNTLGEREKVVFPTTSEIYNAVFENSFDAIYIGTDDGHILKFNKKICKILGYSEKEMINLEGFQIFDINGHAFINFLNERNAKGIAKAEITCIKKSGEKFPCRISSVVYQSGNGKKRSMNTVVDISNNWTKYSPRL